jgi:hypothetical protein
MEVVVNILENAPHRETSVWAYVEIAALILTALALSACAALSLFGTIGT